MANSMRVLKKIETPRPLKSSTTSQLLAIKLPQDSNQVTADSLISIAESIANTLVSKSTDVGLHNNLVWLCHQLKTHGPMIEQNYRDLLNKIFVTFRNTLQNSDTNYNIRLTLLELIELRACQWKSRDGANSYYKTKGSHIQTTVPMDTVILSTSPEPFANAGTPTQLLLGPGEVVRTSGKYNRPTKIPGKNYSKDEVVIRNADSGKVMGIKGRRVHMIEELSETIISFQRVNPGAKERLVQITGPTEEKINHAKQLIEDTIRRNASPVRAPDQLYGGGLGGGGDCDRDSVDSAGSFTLDESSYSTGAGRVSASLLRHSRSVNDASVEEYKYTVPVGDDVIKITGSCLQYVTAAKLELDRYFSSINFKSIDKSDMSDEVFKDSTYTSSEDIAVGFGNGFDPSKESVISPTTPEDNSPKPLVERRKFFSRKSSRTKEFPEPAIDAVYKYSAEALVNFSQSPHSAATPAGMTNITKNNINRMKQVNVVDAIRRWNATNKLSHHRNVHTISNLTYKNNTDFIRQDAEKALVNNNNNNNSINNNGLIGFTGKNNIYCVRQMMNGNVYNNLH